MHPECKAIERFVTIHNWHANASAMMESQNLGLNGLVLMPAGYLADAQSVWAAKVCAQASPRPSAEGFFGVLSFSLTVYPLASLVVLASSPIHRMVFTQDCIQVIRFIQYSSLSKLN